MKGIPKRRGILVVALIAAMVITSGLPVTGTSYAADPPPGSPGAISLSKTASNAGVNKWDITLTVNGSQQGRSSDIVIVMDRSRSMSYTDSGSMPRIEKAKNAAKKFVSQVLAAGSNTRIAVVTFDRDAAAVRDLTNSASELNQKIGEINADYSAQPDSAGGTNIQAGLHMAADLLSGSSAGLKSVILIGDGEPTHSYEFIGSAEAELVSCTVEGGVHKPNWNVSNINSAYDYDGQIVGFGNSYTITAGPAFTVERSCPNDPDNIKHKYLYPENHGIPSIYEAKQLGADGIRVYSVGIGVSSNGKETLQQCVQNGGYLYIDTSDSEYDFSGIADALGSGAFLSVVTDPIGEMFELASEIKVSKSAAPVDYNPATRTITWNVGKLYPGESATMTYSVKAKTGIFTGGAINVYPDRGIYPTNGETAINYNYPSGNSITSYFNVPEVPLTGGAVILKAVAVNSAGHLISASGTEVADCKDAELLSQGRFPEGEDQYMVYGSSCQVSMGAVLTVGEAQYPYRGYACFNSDGSPGQSSADPEVLAADVSMTAGGIQTVFFKYLKAGSPQTLYDVKVRYLDEHEKYIDETKNKVYSVLKGTTVTEEAIHFDHYVLAEGEPSVKSVAVTEPTTITFLYRHLKEGCDTVTVRYVDNYGNKLHDNSYIYDKEFGTTVSASAIAIDNYVLADGETVKYWTVLKPNPEANPPVKNVITFVYKAKPVTPPPHTGGGGGGGGGSVPVRTITPPALNKTDHFAYVVGYPDGEVKPLGTITREEVAVIFYRLMTEDSRKQYYSSSQPFTDVAAGRWSNDEIATLYHAKIVQGNPDGTFEPSKPITRAEFAAIASKFDKLEEVTENKFSDIENSWAKKYINSSAQKGWISGYGDGTFRPDHIIIRCEAMKMINEELDRRVNIAGLCGGTKQWPDNTQDKWYYEIVLEATNTHDYERENRPGSTEKWTKVKDNPVW